MSLRVSFHRAAEHELIDAADYYDAASRDSPVPSSETLSMPSSKSAGTLNLASF